MQDASERASAPAPVQEQAAVLTPDTPEGALLARLRVPITPETLAAARSIENATTALTNAYQKLDALLARLSPAQIPGALRSTIGFVARMDLRNPSSLAEQISSFVADVVDGAESKIADAVESWLSLPVPPPSPEESVGAPPIPGAPSSAQAPPQTAQTASVQPTPAQVTSVAAQAAERVVALAFDPKTAMLQMLAEQPASATALVGALRDALGATTAVQLGALATQTTDPSAITLALPAYFYPGGEPAQLRISRDAAEGKKKLDGDNFHITFLLDTQSMGMVAIDVQTVGRAVSVDVKTQGPSAADRFRAGFGDLRSRLERLRYRIANIGAGVAAPLRSQPAANPQTAPKPRSRFALWDTQA